MKKYLSLVLMLLIAGCSQARTIPDPAVDTPLAKASSQETIVFAGGCFWGVQAVFEHVAVAGLCGVVPHLSVASAQLNQVSIELRIGSGGALATDRR